MSKYRNTLSSSRRKKQNYSGIPGWVKFLILVLVFFGLYLGGRIGLVWDKPNSDSDTRVSVEIPGGSSLNRIVGILEDRDLIRDSWVFKLYVKRHGLGTKLQAGNYIIQRNLRFEEIVEVLQSGKSKEMKVTIPEGSTIDQIDALLARKSLIEEGEFKKCAATCDLGFTLDSVEGYLFPSTYFVPSQGFSSKNFIQRLYRNWKVKIDPLRGDIPPRTVDQVVKVASMIEREAFGDSYEEKQQISDVIWKRLDEGIHLGIDATTRYEKNDWKGALYTADFAKDTPYNTRKRMGLPPTAISNPGEAAIKAAVYPVDTPYYYYLHDPTGKIHFGRTYDEHNENKRKYLY